MKLVHQLDQSNRYIGTVQADEDQLEPGKYHIPFGCVDVKLPKFNPERQFLVFNGKKFVIHNIDFEAIEKRKKNEERREELLIHLEKQLEYTKGTIGSLISRKEKIPKKWDEQKKLLETVITTVSNPDFDMDTYEPINLIKEEGVDNSDFVPLETYVQEKRYETEKKIGIYFKAMLVDCSMESRANIRGKLDLMNSSPIGSIKFKTNQGFINLNKRELELLNIAVNSYAIEMDNLEYELLDKIAASEIKTKEAVDEEFNKFSIRMTQKDYSVKEG